VTAALINELAAAQEQAEMLGDHATAHLLARAAAELAARPTQGQIDAAVARWDHWKARHDQVAARVAGLEADAQWRPIETAPKDQDILLGFAPAGDYLEGFVGEGYWIEGDDDGPDNMGHDAGFMDLHYTFFRCARSFGNEAYQHPGLQPTHWRPLPAPPQEQTP
jgi:hypothetical protein